MRVWNCSWGVGNIKLECSTGNKLVNILQTGINVSLSIIFSYNTHALFMYLFCQIDISDNVNKAHCTHIQHMPVAEPAELAVWREGAVIFNIDADTTGLFLATRSIAAEKIEESGVGSVLRKL